MRLTYLIGEPGVGKTTLLTAITDGLPGLAVRRPFARTLYECGVVELGEQHGVHGGTDKLSMSVQPKVIEWAETPDYQDIVAEGDRLSSDSFFQAMADLGYQLTVVHCHAPSAVAAERRLMRAAHHAIKPQNPVWLKGRQTKVEKLAYKWKTVAIDTSQPIELLLPIATQLPVLDKLWEARNA